VARWPGKHCKKLRKVIDDVAADIKKPDAFDNPLDSMDLR